MQLYPSRPERMLTLAERALPRATKINRMTMIVITEAAYIESSPVSLLRWYAEDPIASLGGRTACQLVTSGQGKLVVRFLRRIREAEP